MEKLSAVSCVYGAFRTTTLFETVAHRSSREKRLQDTLVLGLSNGDRGATCSHFFGTRFR